MKSQVVARESIIDVDQITELERKFDDLEQHGRKGSVRIFGVPENTRGDDTNTKVLHVVNTMMQLNPPISIDDQEVTHLVGKPSLPPGQIDQADEANQPASRDVSAEAAATEPNDVNPVTAESSSRDATQDGQSQPQVPQPILVKFVSRQVKGDMSSRKNLNGKKS